jgi:arabinofuranan 3-O-arabinosyltransferase
VLAANHRGQVVFDTKLGVDIDPAGFLARLWNLWNPLEWLGTLQDQYIGYAFPMAPFYLVTHVIGVPAWLAERLWMSLLIAVGGTGLARLAAALGIGSPRSRLVAGLVFALWPTFTILVGSTSASVLPGVVAPWAVLPLVPAVRRGSVPRAAARSGVAVLCMGGVNAAVTLEALILPGLYILACARGKRRAGLAACWALAVALATSWWAGPLLLQGRYSFNFLPYIEQAATTTRTMSAAAALTGAGNWTAYFNLGTPWLSAGWTMVSAPAAILASAAAAGAGLAGLARRDLPHAAWLRLAAGIAAAGAVAGYWGPLGGPFHAPVDRLLNGTLAPLRNVYKLESVLALVLALGMAHGLAGLMRRAAGPPAATRWAWPGAPRRLAAGAAVVAVLAGLALPYLWDQVLNPGSFSRVPGYWSQVASYLAARSPREPAFVVPADAHGMYVWGSPIDDPLEPLARSPWAERGLVPFGGAGAQTFLDTAETAIESGQQVPGLAAYLARAGVRYVVVRNDLSPAMAGYTSPRAVHQTLAQSGFRRVAAFGPRIGGGPATSVVSELPGARLSYPAVEVYAPAGASSAGLASIGPAQVLPASHTVLVDGGPDALLQLTGQGILGTRPAVVAGDVRAGDVRGGDVRGGDVRAGDVRAAGPSLWAVTDGLRRADNAFGLVTSNVSETYTASQVNPPDDQLSDSGGPPRQLLPVPARLQTVAVLAGAASVTASSVGSWLTEAPQYDPVNAFDGNSDTAWAAGVPGSSAGQWIQVTFHRRLALPARARIRLLTDSPDRAVATRLLVSTAAGRARTALRPAGRTQPLRLPPGPTRWLRLTVTRVRPGAAGGPDAGLRDVLIPGVRVRSYLEPAQDPAGRRAGSQAFSFQQQLPSPALLANAAAYPPLARMFSTAATRRFRLAATAIALPGRALTALLAQLPQAGLAVPAARASPAVPAARAGPAVPAARASRGKAAWAGHGTATVPAAPARRGELVVTASSTLGHLPSLAPANLFRAARASPWIAASAHPVLQLSWRGHRRIGDLVVTPDNGVGASPREIRIASPAGVRVATVGFGGLVTLTRPLITDRLSISFPASQPASAAATIVARPGSLPIALSRIVIPGLAGLRPAVPDPGTTFRLACGQGPELTVDGRGYATAVSGQVTDLINFRPVRVRLCAAGTLRLPAGRHWLTAAAPAPFAVTSLSLTDGPAATGTTSGPGPATADAVRAVTVLSWQAERRSLRMGPGRESYLEVHQNASPGWVATLNGRRLRPVRLDGWQQGYVLPAGAGGIVRLSFAPAGFYHAWLVAAALGVLALLAVALPLGRRSSWRRRKPGNPVPPDAEAGPPAARRTSSAEPLAAGRAGSAEPLAAGRAGSAEPLAAGRAGSAEPLAAGRASSAEPAGSGRPGLGAWAGVAAVGALLVVAGGPVVLAVPALVAVAWWRPRWLPAVTAAGILAAGVITATASRADTLGLGAFSAPAQGCALIALAAALIPPIPSRPGRGRKINVADLRRRWRVILRLVAGQGR